MLVAELRKIEMRKKEREKKQQDLQKLITAAENQADSYRFKYVFTWHTAYIALLRVKIYLCAVFFSKMLNSHNMSVNQYVYITKMGNGKKEKNKIV